MSVENNLTYLQKVALKGEISFALITSSHDAEIKYRTYLILKEVEEEYRPFIIECIKEGITFDETVIDKIHLEVLNGTIPVWLWKEEAIADIKLNLTAAESGAIILGSRLSINRLQEKKNLIESSFLAFARDAVMLHPWSAEELFDEILEDSDMEFLHSACFYLKSACEETKALRQTREIPEELMSCLFDMKRALSFSIETKALKALDRKQAKPKNYSTITKTPLPTGDPLEFNGQVIVQGKFDIDNSITQEELSNYISEKIVELFEGKPNPKPKPAKPSDTVYVVKKVFTDSGISTDLRICKTQKEAMNFIEKIEREYPDLTRTCEFQIFKRRVDEN